MAEYQYSNQYEREETQKYEGIYTPEEIELNQKLQQLCSHEPPDLVAIEALLKQGADRSAQQYYSVGICSNTYMGILWYAIRRTLTAFICPSLQNYS